MEAVIEGGGTHAVQILWQQHAQEEDWGFLLIDEHNNAFNQENHTAILWAVRHKCPSGERFAFN